MDAKSERNTQALQALRKQESDMEDGLHMLQNQQNQLEWLEEDHMRIQREQEELRELLREGWQGERATGFHMYTEEVQYREQRDWRQNIQEQRGDVTNQMTAAKQTLRELEAQQAELRKALSS
ncbi:MULTISPECIES: hypothetical protein [unclassified Listeria]|uniref:hypothetical protein n=1 Tax=unclassified Listeria TaxID=2642072 RepID=UPI000B595F94|nr:MULTISPECIES: hypothetical protein [unclassified Listeria]